MQRVADGFGTLVREHLALARIELIEDVKSVGGDSARVAAFTPFLLVGYLFVCIALAILIGQALGLGWAFLIVGVLNLLVGGVGVALGLGRLKHRRVLDDTVEELRATTALLGTVRQPAEAPPQKPALTKTPPSVVTVTPASAGTPRTEVTHGQ